MAHRDVLRATIVLLLAEAGCALFIERLRVVSRFPNDVHRGLPFVDGSCRFVFSEYVFEHLDPTELHEVASESHRLR